jgi:hypothetical protein
MPFGFDEESSGDQVRHRGADGLEQGDLTRMGAPRLLTVFTDCEIGYASEFQEKANTGGPEHRQSKEKLAER